MTSPDRAVRLLERMGVDEVLIGDLVERRHAGESALWFWRQTVMVVAAHSVTGVRSDPTLLWLAAVAVAIPSALPFVWMHFLMHYAVLLDMAWYPAIFKWFARSSPDALWRFVVALHPWAWTYTAGWCAMLGSTAWLLVRVKPRARLPVVAVFMLSNIAQCLPSLGRSFLDWSHEPANPIWVSNLVSYALFVFLAVPLSIHAGGRSGNRGKSRVDTSIH